MFCLYFSSPPIDDINKVNKPRVTMVTFISDVFYGVIMLVILASFADETCVGHILPLQ